MHKAATSARIAAFLALIVTPVLSTAADTYMVFAGTYTNKGSAGVYSWNFNARTGKAQSLGLAAETSSPSFLALHPNHEVLYAVNEISDFGGQKSGAVSAFHIDRESGKLTLLNQVSTHGDGPCHVSADATGRSLAVANYGGGNFATFPLAANGSIGKAFHVISMEGSGTVKSRQEAPHGHSVNFAPDNKHMLAVDLGTDTILNSNFDAASGQFSPGTPARISTHPGAGPRHLVFSSDGKFSYVINEINSTVVAYSFDTKTGGLEELQSVSTLPEGYTGENSTAEIALHPSGKFLYGSNRGDDSIAIFAVNQETGRLTPAGRVKSGGKTPRGFALEPKGRFLFAANQDSDNIVVFRVSEKTGMLTPTNTILSVKTPVSVVFLPLR